MKENYALTILLSASQQCGRRRCLAGRLPIAAVFASLLASQAAHAQTIDPCLVGTWEAKSVTFVGRTFGAPAGGSGFSVVFKEDGTQAIDYAPMQPILFEDGSKWAYVGLARGRIATKDRVATLESVEVDDVIFKFWGPDPTPDQPLKGTLGPGALGSTKADNTYVCNDKALEYQTSLATDGRPSFLVKLARVTDGGATEVSAPPPSIDAKGKTWLTLTEFKNREQDVQGLWREAREREDADILASGAVHYFKASPSGALTDYIVGKYDEPWSVKMQAEANRAWQGEVQVCPIPYGTCLNLCKWVAGSARVDLNHVTMSVAWRGKKTKGDCSGFEDKPDSGTFELRRVVGVSFVPIAPGKYINVVGAPAVGNQAAQFKAVARIAVNYPGVPDDNVRASVDRGKLILVDKAAGTYEFVAEESGVHELLFELRDRAGTVFHTDRMRVEVPGIPGLGR